jgi:TrmH family RNA methyltransferase
MVMHITSRANPNVKRWKALSSHAQRDQTQTLVWIEGEHVVLEAQRAGLEVAELIVAGQNTASTFAPTHSVTHDVMKALTQLESPPVVAAVLRIQIPQAIAVAGDCLVLDNVQDPGNVGTMLRTAWAFGLKRVLLTRGCASVWSGKALRAGQGAQFWLSIHEDLEPEAVKHRLKVPLLVTSLNATQSLASADLRAPFAFAFGHEGKGVCELLAELADAQVRIPMPGGAESLNVAAACAIVLYEQHRQRQVA